MLLWENVSPDSDFPAQALTIDEMENSQEGDWIALETRDTGVFFNRWSSTTKSFFFMSYSYYQEGLSVVEGHRRWANVLGGTITFQDNINWTSGGYTNVVNSKFRPFRIYRIRL